MTRFIHDQFAKQYLTELLTPFGQVEASKEIASEVREIDVLYQFRLRRNDIVKGCKKCKEGKLCLNVSS